MKSGFSAYVVGVLVLVLTAGLWTEASAEQAAVAAGASNADTAAAAKVKKLISDGGYCYSIGQFDRAIELADAALTLDPQSKPAAELKKISREAIKERNSSNYVREQRKEFQDAMQEINREMVVREFLREGQDREPVRKAADTVHGPAAEILKANREINAKLDSLVVNATFNETPLMEVAQYLRNLSNLNVQVDPRAKVDDKPIADMPVTFKASQMKMRNVLAWITRLNDLTYTVRDEVVIITDKERIKEYEVTAVYDISDIVAPIADYSSIPEFDPSLPAINARKIGEGFYRVPPYWYWHGMGAFTGAYFVDFATQEKYFMTEEDVERLVQALLEGEDEKNR